MASIVIAIAVFISALIKYKRSTTQNVSKRKLKYTGNKLNVLFSDCELKTRVFYETEQKDSLPTRIEMLDSLYNTNVSCEGVEKFISVLVYRYKDPFGKQLEFVSEILEMPVENLRLKLEQEQKTTIYIHQSDSNYYFFDMDFLFQ